MATIDDAGLAIKTLQEYLSEVRQAYRDIDDGWNLEPESMDGLATAIWSERLADLDEALAAAYRSVDPLTATGEQLDRIMFLSGLDRRLSTPSTATVTFTGVSGTTIPQGATIRNSETDTLWDTDQEVTIGGGGTVNANVTAQENGPLVAAIDTLTVIATPVAGVSSVTNNNAAALGTETESDSSARVRRAESVSKPGDNQRDSIEAQIREVSGVTRAVVYENTTSSTDSRGLEPHSIMSVIQGGDVEDIADTIARGISVGVPVNEGQGFSNEVTQTGTTPDGNSYDAVFFRPVLTTLHVSVTIDGDFDSDDVKQAIVDYANGTLLEASGFLREGFGIGDSVAIGRLFTPVNRTIPNESDATEILIGTDPMNLSASSVSPAFNELLVFDTGSITVSSA